MTSVVLLQLHAEKERRRRIKLREAQERAKSISFLDFARWAWPIVWPGEELLENWHLEFIAEALEAVHTKDITRLIVNIPPGFAKSTLISVLYPAWKLLKESNYTLLSASNDWDLSKRDAMKTRELVQSQEYREHFGIDWEFKRDINRQDKFETTAGASRKAVTCDGRVTGKRANHGIIDDPLDASDATSPTKRESNVNWYRNIFRNRLNPGNTQIIVMQRLHKKDLTGDLTKKSGHKWTVLSLAMRFNPKRRCKITLREYTRTIDGQQWLFTEGLEDPRKEKGELLFPQRYPQEEVDDLLEDYTPDAAKMQLDQHVDFSASKIWPRDKFKLFRSLPVGWDRKTISCDFAFKKETTHSKVSIGVWLECGVDRYLIYAVAQHLGYTASKEMLKHVAIDLHRDADAKLIEDKANGTAIEEDLRDEIPGIVMINPQGGKIVRAQRCQADLFSGHIYVGDPEIFDWAEDFLNEVDEFPAGDYDDQVDMASQFINWSKDNPLGDAFWDNF